MATKINAEMGPTEWLMLLLLSLLWGGSFFFVEIAVHALPPLTLVVMRVGLAAVVLWAIAILRGIPVPGQITVWFTFFVMGLMNNVIPFVLIVIGQKEITSGLAAILNATTPLFTVVVAGLLLKDEKATPLKLTGVLVGFMGVVIMIGPTALAGLGSSLIAQAAILIAALSYAFAGVYGRRFKVMGIDPIITAAGQVTASTFVLLPLALWFEQPFSLPMPDAKVWLSIFGLAVISTAFAYILYFRLLSTAGATNLLLVTFLIPVTAIALGISILGEELQLIQLAGMGLIGLGLAVIDGRLFKR